MLETDGVVRVRDLPRLSGVSKEAVAMALSFLSKRDYVTIGKEGSAKVVSLTSKGRRARDDYRRELSAVETRWIKHFGAAQMTRLRSVLEGAVADGLQPSPELLEAIEPATENWRAAAPRPQTLPHFPMVLHRGGYPDGS